MGWLLADVGEKMSARELTLRVTQKMVRDGYTFDPVKIQKFHDEQNQRRVQEFMQRARQSWGSNKK